MIDLGEMGDQFPDFEPADEFGKPSGNFIPQYTKGDKELFDKPVIWDNADMVLINDAMSVAINNLKIPPLIYVGDTLLDYLSGAALENKSMMGTWVDCRDQHGVQSVKFSWVEDNRLTEFDENKGYGGVKLEIEKHDGKKEVWVWMVNHEEPDSFDVELLCWKAKWRD